MADTVPAFQLFDSCRPLADRLCRGLDRGHRALIRLMGAGPGADVEHGPGVAESGVDPRRDPRVGAAHPAVPASQPVVGHYAHRLTPAAVLERPRAISNGEAITDPRALFFESASCLGPGFFLVMARK